MITELSAEQKARFPEFVEKWSRIGLCTDPANRPKAEEGVRLAYRSAGMPPPSKIVWCDSPLSLYLGRIEESAKDSVGDSIGYSYSLIDSVWTSVGDSIMKSVRKSVRDLVWESVGMWLLAMVPASFRDSVVESVLASVVESTATSVRRSVQLSVRNSFRLAVYGQYSIAWYSFYDYFRVVCGLSEDTAKMPGITQISENAGWWMPCQDICWICERPDRLIRDDRGRLHCEDGPALSYPDGLSVYSIHGVQVDEQIVLRPESQDVDKIRNERDAEVKRIRIERFGWPEYLRKVGATVLDVRDNDVEATKEALMRTPDYQVVLVCACPSTSRVYCLEVPPAIATCEDAQDWLSGGLARRVINGA